MDDDQRGHLEALRQAHQRRLRILEQQAALAGANTRPEILLEIDDIRTAIGELDTKLAPIAPDVSLDRPTPPQEQRKLVTVLRANVHGLADLALDMDPEDAADLLAKLRQRSEALFARFGGQASIQNDGHVQALWGTHASREDDPEQAVRAALAIREELAALCAEQQIELSLQIGLSTGLLLVGGASGAVGEATTLAGRVAQEAALGQILVANETYRHVRGLFDVEPLEPGSSSATSTQRTYIIIRAKPRQFHADTRGIEGIETRMVGRDAEMKLLQDAFCAASEDRELSIITVVADAGLGKSRLLHEFASWVKQLPQPPQLFKGRAVPATQQQPFVLLRDLFALHFDIQENDQSAKVCEKVELGFGTVFGRSDAERQRSQVVGHLLGFVPRESSLLQDMVEDARAIHDRGTQGMVDYFRTLAERAPVVLLLEDIHWADDSSLDVITTIADSLQGKGLLVVCAARPSLTESRPHWGEGQSFHTRLDLRPLSSRDSRRLVEDLLQRVEHISASTRDVLVNSAEGNPFYVEELIKMLIDDGAIRVEGERWTIDMAQLTVAKVPTTLIGVLQARLDKLSAFEQIMLQRASVVGRIFWDATIAEMGKTLTEQSPAAGNSLAQVFQVLRARELIYQRERSVFSAVQEYAFKHALLRDVTYDRVLKRARRNYHLGAARWLVLVASEAGRADEYATRIAEHYDHAGEAAEAAAWYGRAGKHAAVRYANGEALAYLNRALTLAPKADADVCFDLLLAREKLLDLQGDRSAQFADIDMLTTLAERLNDDRRRAVVELRRANYADCIGDFPMAIAAARDAIILAEAAGMATSQAAGYLAWGQAAMKIADYPTARERLEQARALAKAANLPGLEADSLLTLGRTAWSQGDSVSAQAAYEQALTYYKQIGHRRNEGRIYNNLGLVARKHGEYATARTAYEQALALFREIGDRTSESVVLSNIGLVAKAQDDYVGSQTALEQALELCRQVRNSLGESKALINLGNIIFARGNYGEAYSTYELGLELCRQLGNRADENRAIFNLGLVDLAVGNYGSAQTRFESALSFVREIGDQSDTSEILVFQSILYAQLGDQQPARTCVEEALLLAQGANNRPIQGLAWHQIGQLLLREGQPDQAIQAFEQAVDLHKGLGQQTWTVESIAGVAQAHLNRKQTAQALAQVENILAHLEQSSLDGAYDPFRVYLTSFHVLVACRDQRARPLLRAAIDTLLKRAAMIADLDVRRLFLVQVPTNRTLLAAGQAITAGAARSKRI